ncbi:MAG: tetratricopeptide repeat protein, partial [Gemmataceae bacterium]
DEAKAILDRAEKQRIELDRANKLLRAEAEHPTGEPDRLAKIGEVLLQVGQEKQGVYWLEKALQRDPGHQPAHQTLADFYQSKGEAEKAAAHRRQIHEAQPKATGR